MIGLLDPENATLDELVEAFSWMVRMIAGEDGPQGWLEP